MQYATKFALSVEEIDSVLIGVDTPKQLNEIVGCVGSRNEKFELESLARYVRRLSFDDVRPEKWKQLCHVWFDIAV